MSKAKAKRKPVVTVTLTARCERCGVEVQRVDERAGPYPQLPTVPLWKIEIHPPDGAPFRSGSSGYRWSAAVCEACAKALGGERVAEEIDAVRGACVVDPREEGVVARPLGANAVGTYPGTHYDPRDG